MQIKKETAIYENTKSAIMSILPILSVCKNPNSFLPTLQCAVQNLRFSYILQPDGGANSLMKSLKTNSSFAGLKRLPLAFYPR